MSATRRRAGVDVAEDVEFLREQGVPAEEWPARLGMTPAALARALYRARLHELARPVERIRSRAQAARVDPDPCPECGEPKRAGNTFCSTRCAGIVGARRLWGAAA